MSVAGLDALQFLPSSTNPFHPRASKVPSPPSIDHAAAAKTDRRDGPAWK